MKTIKYKGLQYTQADKASESKIRDLKGLQAWLKSSHAMNINIHTGTGSNGKNAPATVVTGAVQEV